MDTPIFHVGDVVRIMDDVTEVKRMQRGHGEWNDSMTEVNLLTFPLSSCIIAAILSHTVSRETCNGGKNPSQWRPSVISDRTTLDLQSFLCQACSC